MKFLKKLFNSNTPKVDDLPTPPKEDKGSINDPENQDDYQTNCPYCGYKFDIQPKRKRKCPECKESIFVKRRLWHSVKQLVTESEAEQIDHEWDSFHLEKSHIEKFENYGLSKTEYNQEKSEWKGTNSGSKLLPDFLWSIYNKLITKHANDYKTLQMLYFEMALFLKTEGKSPNDVLKLSKKMELMNLKDNGANRVSIITAKSASCEDCQRLEGKKFSIDKALETMPLPCENCSSEYGYCRCVYGGIL